MPAFNLRGLEDEVMALLKRESKERQMSVNLLIIQFIEQGLGYGGKMERVKYHDLDSLAGTWSDADAKLFEENTRYFEQVEEDLWR